jgi:hypothetical protein
MDKIKSIYKSLNKNYMYIDERSTRYKDNSDKRKKEHEAKESNQFKVGDVVYVNSNPELLMTISNIDDTTNIITTLHFDGEKQENTFPRGVLTKHVSNSTDSTNENEINMNLLMKEMKNFMDTVLK